MLDKRNFKHKIRGGMTMKAVRELFAEIDQALKDNPSHVAGVEAIYQFNLDNDEVYQLVLKEETNYATEGKVEDADCTLVMATDDFIKMAAGELNGTQAFMSGRLKIKGNMGLALKLQSILASYNTSKN